MSGTSSGYGAHERSVHERSAHERSAHENGAHQNDEHEAHGSGPSPVELAELLSEVRRIEAQSKRLVTGALAGAYSSVFRGSGIEFHEIREYVDGDDPRTIDWNMTARLGRPFVKLYVEERELTMVFLLDLSASMTGGFGAWSARQMAARICACLALSATKNDDKVGFIAFSKGVDKFVPPRKGIRHALRIVRDCLALPGSSMQTKAAPALEFASRTLKRHTTIFLVSDFLGTGWQHAMSLCAKRHDLVAVRILTPELSPQEDAGLMRVQDPETGLVKTIDWKSAKVREAYRAKVKAWQLQNEADFRRAEVDLMDVPIPRWPDRDAVARPILEFFHMRELRGAKR